MNYTKQIFLIAFIIINALFITSCDKQLDELQPINEDISSFLGKKLENPYSVKNMRKAFENLKQNDKSGITVSHLYIKFKPKNEDDLNLIKRDSTLNLFNYPLDYEVVEGQEAYRDPEVSTSQPTYLYASIKVDYDIPDVEYEVIEELFIPEEIEEKNDSFYTDDLVYEALRITNNLDYDENEKGSKWRPKGTIKLWDKTKNQYVFPDGLKVRATRWFTTHTGFVNTNGYYSCNGRFRGKARYRIDWERYNFALRDGFWNSAQYKGPYKKGDWNWTISNGNIHQFYGTIFRAAFHYYYKNIKGLRRPPLNSFWHVQLRILAKNEVKEDALGTHCPGCRFLGLGSAIKIYNPQRDSEDIYATTIHELTHASHWNMNSWHYNNGDAIVVESWARGVQWELTRMVYSSYEVTYGRLNYTGIVQDMINGYGNRSTSSWWDYDEDGWGDPPLFKYYYDQVTGYSIRQIEDALVGERYWNNWKNDIKNSYNNATENNLDSSFDFWNTY
ncbi:MAG TPA: hypothetical protein EYG92_06135 [Lutibacter sp.]|nr:hypothetical protein [Lutibacter sp.]